MGNVGQNTNRMKFLNGGIFSGNQVFLSIIFGKHLVAEKEGSNCVVELRLEYIKNNPNFVRCTDIRKYNCEKIITMFCFNKWQNIKEERKK